MNGPADTAHGPMMIRVAIAAVGVAAALMVMKKSNEMLASAIDLGGYGTPVER